MGRIPPWALVILLLLAGSLTGCSSERPNLIVVLIDTLRYDRLGMYGSERGLTPFLDSFAEHAYVFERAYAQSSWTNPSVASLFTSRYQWQHKVTETVSVLEEREVTLAEVLSSHGYSTGGFCANIMIGKRNGFTQGFDHFRTMAGPKFTKLKAGPVNQKALAWIDQQIDGDGPHRPFFLYLHYMEPHNPYSPPAELLDRVLKGRPRPDLDEINRDMIVSKLVDFSPEMLQGVSDAYDAEVMSLDLALSELFEELQSRGILDNSIVFVVADHGEEFMEHEGVGHHRTLFEEVIRIPFLVRLPGQSQRVDVERVAMLTDIAPSFLALARLDAVPSFEGEVLRPLEEGLSPWARIVSLWKPAAARRPAFSTLIRRQAMFPHQRTVIFDRRKLITGKNGEQEFYDLRNDPAETNADALNETERSVLVSSLKTFLRGGSGHIPPGARRTIDADTAERMRALGYQPE